MTEYVQRHPDDASRYYTLGRIHYLAFAYNGTSLSAFRDVMPPSERVRSAERGRPVRAATIVERKIPDEAERATHLKEALRYFKTALEMDPGNGLYELGLACIYEDGRPPVEGSAWQDEAIAHYLAAYQASIRTDRELKSLPLFGLETLVSYEAGESYLRLVRQRGVKNSEAARVKAIEKDIAALQRLQPSAITPIVLSLNTGNQLTDLLSSVRVKFDLDGTGRPQSCSWLQPNAAFLVWDPEHTGRITSGRQLFGSVTWWMFWEDGYQALAALDDNHDGWLRGRELVGLALWFDRNQNGIADPGEVIAIEDTDVEALAVFADAWDGTAHMNSRGARLRSGREVPTWDWVAMPVVSMQ